MKTRYAAAAAAALVAGGALAAPPAGAYYGNGASIASADLVRGEQGDDTTLSADIASGGRYVAFQTRARNLFADDDPDPPGRYRQGGIFRRDLDSGAPLSLVASGDVRDESSNVLITRGAANPSASGDGRYVAFSTGQSLVPADQNGNVDVYVRDMSLASTAPGAFDLVSARDGGDAPAAYAPRSPPAPGIDPGSEVTRGAAISDDGRYVVFRTLAASNLPAAASTSTSAGQLFVRDREGSTTKLVTRNKADGAPAGGALGSAISADGTTVAWTGRSAPAQTTFLGGESAADLPYYLWRRVADGPTAPTRRITGMVDPDDPSCPPGTGVQESPTETGPCYGPLTSTEYQLSADISSLVPALSGDGRRVAFLTGSGPRPNGQTPDGLDAWVTDMSPGVSRKAGSLELSREATATDPGIETIALSADGRYLALTTQRNQFPLPTLNFVGTPRSTPTARELYLADLGARTLERVLRSFDGGEINSSVNDQPALASGAGRIAFVSGASNLFFGDANERADAFAVSRQAEPGAEAPPPPLGSGVPDSEVTERDPPAAPRLGVKTRSLRGGVIEVTTSAPAAGAVKVTAKGSAGKGRRKRTVTLSTGAARARKKGLVRIRLRPVRRYRAELRKRKKIVVRLSVQYVAARGNKRLSRSLRATFIQEPPRRKRKR